VVGVEAAGEALSEARIHAATVGLHFVRADALALPFLDASFDAVVSFETIEHLADAHGLLAECRRILRPGGRLYLSTPNRTVTRLMPPNPFHVREFTDVEILEVVGQHFRSVACFWQRPVFFPTFVLRQLGRRCVAAVPGGQSLWRLWKRTRPRRIQAGATTWWGSRFDQALGQDRHYRVAPARRTIGVHPMYTVLVAR